MKKALIILFLALAVVALCLTGCAPPEHTHQFGGKYLHDASSHWQLCSGDECNEKSQSSPHVWNDGVQTDAPTYTKQGKKLFTCTTCGATKEEPIPVLEASQSTVVFANTLSLDKVFDGTAVTLSQDDYTTTGNGTVTVEWIQGQTTLDGAPILPGEYTVKVSISASEGYTQAHATKNFTISKKALTGTISANADFGATELSVELDGILTGAVENDTLGLVTIGNNGDVLLANASGYTSGLTLSYNQDLLDKYDVSGVGYNVVINKVQIPSTQLLIDNIDTLPTSFCVEKGIVSEYTYTGAYADFLGTAKVEYADTSVGVTMVWTAIAPKKVGNYAVRISFEESENLLATRTTPVEFSIESHDISFDGYCVVDGVNCYTAPIDFKVDDDINTKILPEQVIIYRFEL